MEEALTQQNLELKEIPHKGKALFATKDFEQGKADRKQYR
jgi:hypothetical protein